MNIEEFCRVPVRLLLQPYNIRTTHRYSHTTISALLYCRTAATYSSALTLLHPITRDLRPPFCDYRTSCLHALPPMDALRDSCPWISLPDLWSQHTLLTYTAYHRSFSRVNIPLPLLPPYPMIILSPIFRYDHPSLPILCITGMITLPPLCTDDGNIGSAPVLGLALHRHPLVSHGHRWTIAISTDTVPLWSRMA